MDVQLCIRTSGAFRPFSDSQLAGASESVDCPYRLSEAILRSRGPDPPMPLNCASTANPPSPLSACRIARDNPGNAVFVITAHPGTTRDKQVAVSIRRNAGYGRE